MTNRDKLDKLSNFELVYLTYHKLIPIGKRYVSSERGLIEWLSAEADWEWWRAFHNEVWKYSETMR